MSYNIPIALFIFKRPEVTRKTFARIARMRPSKLLIVCDGPRHNVAGEADLVAETQMVAKEVNWPCTVLTNFSGANLGCKMRMSTGISWVFEQVDRAILLEDDCIPSDTFFRFCQEMLDRYEQDKTVYAIAGSSFTGRSSPVGHIHSDYSLMWGWATWRDRWNRYELSAGDYRSVLLSKWWHRPIDYMYWLQIYKSIAKGELDTWDYQWVLTLWRNGAKCVRPTVNLIENDGFGEDATHTKTGNRFADLKVYEGDAAALRKKNEDQDVIQDSEKFDRTLWAMINIRTVLLLYIPFLKRFKRTQE